MKYMFIIALTIMMAVLLVEGWVRNTEASNSYTEDLEARIAALEEELAFQSQWSEPQGVVNVVIDKLWERMNMCTQIDPDQFNSSIPDHNCYRHDPVLSPFYEIPGWNREYYIGNLIANGTWSAENQEDDTWLVTGNYPDGPSYIFVANSRYHLICWDQTPGCLQ
jgi:hypothetical protein